MKIMNVLELSKCLLSWWPNIIVAYFLTIIFIKKFKFCLFWAIRSTIDAPSWALRKPLELESQRSNVLGLEALGPYIRAFKCLSTGLSSLLCCCWIWSILLKAQIDGFGCRSSSKLLPKGTTYHIVFYIGTNKGEHEI
jgi:hypothetical protein